MVDEAYGPLHGVHVLDLTTRRAELAGRSLAELGAVVLKIEPPGGCDSRTVPPFDEHHGPGGISLYWAAVGMGKLSVTLDITSLEGREQLRRLASRFDVLIESFDPGYMDSLGLGYGNLHAINPRLVYMSVTPYGQTGPKANWPATELTIEAACGRMALQGDRDRPPLPIGYPQAAFHSGAQAACDIIIALNEREVSGLGQRLDLSMQEAMIWTLMDATGYPPNTGGDPVGGGDDRAHAPVLQRSIPCADGYMNGRAGDVVLTPYSKAHLMELAVAQDVRLAPVNTTEDLLNSPQFAAREYWQLVDGFIHPGVGARLSRTPAQLRPAPRTPGQHQAMLEGFLAEPVPTRITATAGARTGLAFQDLRIADFSWVAVGPLTAKAFADHGATVVRVESGTRLDVLRGLGAFKDNIPDVNRSQWFANMNTSKLGLSLNLGTPEGRAIAKRLIDWADVVVESFTPGTMARWGFDYETLKEERPDLIMLSTCLLGQTGPWASYGGFGGHGAALAGLHYITGWPDRPPAGPSGPYTDVIAPRYTVAALAAAVLERRRSGLGQHIDVSQVEAAVHFIEPLVLDQSVNGHLAMPAGHDSLTACPHGVYQAAGIERYIAIAVETSAQWQALRALLQRGQFATVDDSLEGRLKAREEIDACLREWIRPQDPWALEKTLIAAGVPCSVVERPTDLYRDPQLRERGFFVGLNHAEMGPTPYDGFATRFSARREMLRGPGPVLGQHTGFVLNSFLGMTPAEIEEAAASGALW